MIFGKLLEVSRQNKMKLKELQEIMKIITNQFFNVITDLGNN